MLLLSASCCVYVATAQAQSGNDTKSGQPLPVATAAATAAPAVQAAGSKATAAAQLKLQKALVTTTLVTPTLASPLDDAPSGDSQTQNWSPSAIPMSSSMSSPTVLPMFSMPSAAVPLATPLDLPVGYVPAPVPGADPSGQIVGNGLIPYSGSTQGFLVTGSVLGILNPTPGYVSNGGLHVSTANFEQGYSTLSALGLPLLNLTAAGLPLVSTGGNFVGQTGINSNLTLVGASTSNSYIYNINNGAPNGLLGLILPGAAPAWAAQCLNVAGLVTESCWGVNAAQNNQVLVGDGATANGSEEVVIGTNASHTLPLVNANTAFPGDGTLTSPTDPEGVPDADYAARLGHSVVIGDSASGTANAQTILGANATSDQINSVALGFASIADRGPVTGYLAPGLGGVLQNSAGEVSIGSPGLERQITNVAPGSALTDAVNVAQLEGVGALAANSVQYDDPSDTIVTLAGPTSTDGGVTGGTTITNLHQGALSATSTDAVNGAQLFATDNSITNINNTGTKYFQANSILAGADASGANSVAAGPLANAGGVSSVAMGNGATAAGDNGLALGAGADASMANSIALGNGSTTLVGALTNYTAYGLTALQSSAGEVNIGNRQITGVAAGSAADDAVNVAQLEGVGTQVQAVNNLAVKYDADALGNPTNTVTLTGDNSGAPVGITNLAVGAETATSTDAVNGSQLWHWTQDPTNIYSNYSLYNDFINAAPGTNGGVKYFNVNSTLANSSASGANSIAIGPVAAASGTNSVAVGNAATATANNSVAIGAGSVADRDNTVSVGAAGNDRQITNVAAGTETTDAVNVGQLTSSVAASTAGNVRYDTNSDGSVDYSNVNLGNGTGNTMIHNVAPGTADTDAVNVSQLNGGVQQAENWAAAYTNGQVQQASHQANAGIAAAMAMAGLPQAYEPGKSMASVAAGTFRGESSLAVGISTISENGRWVYKLTGSTDSRGDTGVAIGAGTQW